MDNLNAESVPDVELQSASPATFMSARQLLFKPAEFFLTVDLKRGHVWWVAAWLVGVAAMADRIDQGLMKADLGVSHSSEFGIADNRAAYWAIVLPAGTVLAAWIWFLGGWWYWVRVRWSSERNPDLREAQLVYTFAGLVSAIPTVLYTIYATMRFPNYRTAWQNDSTSEVILALVVGVLAFWSYFVSYRGVRMRFAANKWPARIWFLILPAGITLVAGVVPGVMYAALPS